jgi:filamentous hemagglutinin
MPAGCRTGDGSLSVDRRNYGRRCNGVDHLIHNQIADTNDGAGVPAEAQDFQAGTSGASSHIATRKAAGPAIRYDNPNPRGVNFLKLDAPSIEAGPDGLTLLLIDAKTKPAIFNAGAVRDRIATLRGVRAALQRNPGFKVVYEYPTKEMADQAGKLIKENGFGEFVTTRARDHERA